MDGGVPIEAVRAALRERGADAALAARTAKDIREEMRSGEAGRLYQVMAALARPVRLTRGKDVDPSWVADGVPAELPEEAALLAAYRGVAARVAPGMAVGDFLAAAEGLVSPLDAYFDKVFVMCEDEGLRRSRLALLRDLAALPRGILDLAELPGF